MFFAVRELDKKLAGGGYMPAYYKKDDSANAKPFSREVNYYLKKPNKFTIIT